MKLRDAERCGKASTAMIERLNVAIEKLSAKERAVLAAIESLETINPALEKAFGDWVDLAEELDPDAEISMPAPISAPSFDLQNLTEAITMAFSDARTELECQIEAFEEIVTLASEYEEPEEEKEDDADTEAYVFSCDHPGCKVEIDGPSQGETERAAESAGWLVEEEKCWCPKHAGEAR